jgi:molecular chaperone DnaK (HSP70)
VAGYITVVIFNRFGGKIYEIWQKQKPKGLYTIANYIVTMATTTIQISTELLDQLKNRKIVEKESYEELIWDLLEDTMELSEQTKKDIEKSRKEIAEGKTVSLDAIKKRLRL